MDLSKLAYERGRACRRAGFTFEAGNPYSGNLREAWESWRRGWTYEDTLAKMRSHFGSTEHDEVEAV